LLKRTFSSGKKTESRKKGGRTDLTLRPGLNYQGQGGGDKETKGAKIGISGVLGQPRHRADSDITRSGISNGKEQSSKRTIERGERDTTIPEGRRVRL